MKITKILLWLSYLSLVLSISAFVVFALVFLKRDFNAPKAEKGSLEGVVSKSISTKFQLPMDLDVEYYFRIKEGEVLVDSYFLKIQKKFLANLGTESITKKESDYPKLIAGNLYAMPESDYFQYLSIPYSGIKSIITFWKFYAVLAFLFFLAANFLTIRFLQNCSKGLFFVPENATYLRIISYLAIGFSLLSYGSQWILFKVVNKNFYDLTSINMDSVLEFNWTYLIASLFLALIAQAFAEGIKLKEEQNLTI